MAREGSGENEERRVTKYNREMGRSRGSETNKDCLKRW